MMHRFYYPYYFQSNPGWTIFSLIINVLFWVLVIWLIVALVKHLSHNNERQEEEVKTGDSNQYLEIIKRRYAEGEINKKEYQELKKDLS